MDYARSTLSVRFIHAKLRRAGRFYLFLVMEEQEFQNLTQVGKLDDVSEKVLPAIENEVPMGIAEPQSMEDLVNLLRLTKRNLSADPATNPPPTPRNFLEQFQLHNNNLFAFFGDSWKKVGGGMNVKLVAGSRSVDGNFSLSGFGFQPKGFIGIGFSGKTSGERTVGIGDATNQRAICDSADNIYGAMLISTDAAGSNFSRIELVSFNSDGVTLSVTSGGTNQLPIYYVFLFIG